MPAGNDTAIFITAFTFLILSEFFIGAIGAETRSFNTQIGQSYSTDATGTPTSTTETVVVGVVNCIITAISPVFDLAENLFLPGLSGCGFTSTVRNIPVISDILKFAQTTFAFFEQFLAFQFTSLPLWLNLLLIVPSSSTMVFIGLRFIRGVS